MLALASVVWPWMLFPYSCGMKTAPNSLISMEHLASILILSPWMRHNCKTAVLLMQYWVKVRFCTKSQRKCSSACNIHKSSVRRHRTYYFNKLPSNWIVLHIASLFFPAHGQPVRLWWATISSSQCHKTPPSTQLTRRALAPSTGPTNGCWWQVGALAVLRLTTSVQWA